MNSNKAVSKKMVSALLFVIIFTSAGYAATFDEIVVFGDSLSDNGNLLLIENQPKPDPAIYFEGRFSNGPVWVEYLADVAHFNVNLSDRALGGAQSGGVIGLKTQIDGYIATTGPSFSDTALFVIWIGGNDFFNGDGNFQSAVGNIKDALERLVDFGARNFLVLNLPDLGLIPDELGDPEAPQATEFTMNFNADLANRLAIFRAAHPEVNLYEFDADALFATIRNDPAAYGFSNVTDPSPNFDVPDNFDGAGHVFWDGKHPTTEMHAVIADQVYADINAQAPPPETNTGNDNGNSTCFIGASMN
ncbi:MAG: SGNH/GDSL hydrolase family protein [Desulfobacterales bacterium]